MEGKIDVKLKELEARLDAKWDARLDEKLSNYPTIDQMDARFANVDAQFAKLDARFAQIDGKFRLIFWMLAAIMASITIPALHTLLTAG